MAAARLRRWTRRLGVLLASLVLLVIAVIVAALLVVQTPWAKDKLRALIVRQANDNLNATLDIGHLEGSLFSEITLRDIRLVQNGRPLVAIDTVSVTYSIRQIWRRGVAIDRIHLVMPRVTATKQADGRWDLASLVRKKPEPEQPKGPGRAIHLGSVEIDDGTIVLNTPVEFGAVHIPSRYEHLNTRLGFDYVPGRWTLRFRDMAWRGADPDLTIDSLTGALGSGPHGFGFDRLAVRTPRSAFTVSGTIHNEQKPTALDLDVHATRFAFQEWGGILHGLRNIAVESRFDVALNGPVTAMATDLRMSSTAGTIGGTLTLDTSVPGWTGRGAVDIARLNLAGWLNRPDRPSDITGHVVFDLALRLGQGFPRGRYDFRGPHAGFMEYAADNVAARGDISLAQVFVNNATARAYGADVTATGTIAIDDPYRFHFAGTTVGLDLRRVPKTVPVPRVESTLAFDYDVRGQFAHAFIAGRARLAQSVFLGATIADGTVGSIDSSAHPLRYSGDGEITGVDLGRFGAELDIAMLREPRYQGRVSGRFTLDASGTSAAELDLHASGRLFRADVFNGTLTGADVSLDIANGTLAGSYDGRFEGINPAVPLLDPRFDASLSGSGRVSATVRDLLLRTAGAADYDIDWDLVFGQSKIRGVDVDTGRAAGTFREALTHLTAFDVTGPVIVMHGDGTLAFTDTGQSAFTYVVDRADLAHVAALAGYQLGGQLTTHGTFTGPWSAPHLAGTASALDPAAPGARALTATGDYDFDVPFDDPLATTGRLTGSATFLTLGSQEIRDVKGTLALADRQVTFDVTGTQSPLRMMTLDGQVTIAADRHSAAIDKLTVTLGGAWRLQSATGAPARVAWTDEGVSVTPVVFVGGATGDERIGIGGNWRAAGGGELRITATNLHLESLQSSARPPRYGGLANVDAVVSGTRDAPIVTGTMAITGGRVDRFAFQKLAGRVDYTGRVFTIDFRLDQGPDTWATAAGRVPLALFDRRLPEAPIDVRVVSSPIALGLLNGLTSVVRDVSGEGVFNVHAIGTSRDPHFEGHVAVSNAAFVVAATGVAYNRVQAAFGLSREQISVEALHVEDTDHDPLDLHGSLATHELRVGALEIEARARHFIVLRNDLGNVAADADITVSGRFEAPVVGGKVTLTSSTVNVDNILEETVFRPYATSEAPIGQAPIADLIDPLAALNPWERLKLALTVHVPDTLRLAGENVQISPGTPIGLGDFNLRVGGDLVVLKDPAGPLTVYGSFDRMSGTYGFQGRRFTVAPTSSINFRGDLSPELFVTVTREISGVEARVTISGPLGDPELHLASTPPLETTDILSLIVFNASLNDLTAAQQQQLAVRAGALAAGFLATPLVSALENRLGLDVLELSPGGDFGVSPKVTVGEEIAPGLMARFSRQFGENEYNQLEIEYYLTRILQLRATFSDAGSVNLRSPFRRIERGGIDLILFFSF